MTEHLSLPVLIQSSARGALRVAGPTLPFGILFAFACGYLVWAAGSVPQGPLGTVMFAALALITLYAHSLFSAAMYRVLLPKSGSLRGAAWRLSLAWVLLITASAIILFILSLFFSLFSVILVAISGHDPSQGDPLDATASIAAMQASGAIWLLYVMLATAALGLFWFAVRVMTFAAATVARQKVHVFRTWGWTKSYVLTLGAAMSALILVPILLLMAASLQLPSLASGAVDAGLRAGLTGVILLPSAWLGHAFAAEVYRQLAQVPADT